MAKTRFMSKTIALLAAAAMSLTSLPSAAFAAMDTSEFSQGYAYSTEMRGLSAFQIVNDMGPGWNLGNSLESADNETNWGNPKTTKAMIDAVAAQGYRTLRVPVRWDDNYSDASTYTINSAYMDRVETVVNYGLANDMYVILNVHHNDLQEMVPDTSRISSELEAIWTQVGERFKNYGDKLIFEVNNEPRSGDDWTGNSEYYQSVNESNEAARAAIRATGGNNEERLVMLPTYCASCDADKAAAWTKNYNDDMIAVSIHAYLPFDFAFNSAGHTDWLESDLAELKSFFNRAYNYFIGEGIPVVIGEFGTQNKNNTAARETHAAVYGSLARQFAEQDIPCVVWDNHCFNTDGENFGLFDRNSRTFVYGGVASALINEYSGDPDYETSVPSKTVLSSGGTSSGWGQAVKLSGSVAADMKAGQQICAVYSSANTPEMILADYGTSKNWVKVNPDSVSGGVATWTYETLLNAFEGTFDGIDDVYIGDTGAELTVTEVYINNPDAHTHNFNTDPVETLAPSETTYGRSIISCSVNGCSAYRITVTAPVKLPKAEMFEMTLPESLKYDGKAKAVSVSVKAGIAGMGEITAIKYVGEDGAVLTGAPIEKGTYTVKIDVAKGVSYAAAENLEIGQFTIEAADLMIVTQPTDFTGKIGDTAVFTIEAEGENVTYQWQQNTGSGWVSINTTAGRRQSISVVIT
ncbi:MAG: cellulase family glycosylhydrolase, partial [Oscillospiraceae bacterium]|nr:cellulase family glycosylhydrolase [Oscillospiraceae bacterium]